jgi:hypothetical protein
VHVCCSVYARLHVCALICFGVCQHVRLSMFPHACVFCVSNLCACVCVCVYVCVCVHIYAGGCICVCGHMCAGVYMFVFFVGMRVGASVLLCCVCVCVCVCVFVC